MPQSAPSFTCIASTSALLRPASSSAMSRMLIAMESSCPGNTSSALPADLGHFAVLQQHGNGALASEIMHTSESGGVQVHIEFNKFAAREFQPFAHLLRVRAAGRAEQFKHGRPPHSPHGVCDK